MLSGRKIGMAALKSGLARGILLYLNYIIILFSSANKNTKLYDPMRINFFIIWFDVLYQMANIEHYLSSNYFFHTN